MKRNKPGLRFGVNQHYVKLATKRDDVPGRGLSHFYSPAYTLAQQIADANNPDKVLVEAPRTTLDEERIAGHRVAVARRLRTTERAACWLLPNGYLMWLPLASVLSDNGSHIRVNDWAYRKKRRLIGFRPIDGMVRVSKEQMAHEIIKRRTQGTQ